MQILKRNRDLYFAHTEDHDLVPPSIVITTLAGLAYRAHRRAGDDLAVVVRKLITTMPDHVERRNGKLWVPNPTNDEENFADRLAEKGPGGEGALTAWLRDLQGVLDTIEGGRGLDRVAAVLDEGFGPDTGQRVLRRMGAFAGEAKSAGRILTTAAGSLMLTQPGRTGTPKHTFYGAHER